MARYKITVEYDGGSFVGWQAQDNGPSVQETIEAAIAKFAGPNVRIHAAGRTDRGVHAKGQVFHFDMTREMNAFRTMQAINALVRPAPISVLKAEIVDDTFHARFSAKKRHYLYRIINRSAPLAIERGHAWHVPEKLDANAMADAATVLIGHHDFTTFRAVYCQSKSPVKTLDRLDIGQEGEEIRVYASARSFLHHQVRSMVGSLKLVGEGKWDKKDLKAALEAKDRQRLGFNAPPDGLYLTGVDY